MMKCGFTSWKAVGYSEASFIGGIDCIKRLEVPQMSYRMTNGIGSTLSSGLRLFVRGLDIRRLTRRFLRKLGSLLVGLVKGPILLRRKRILFRTEEKIFLR
jgi:hypothetical protein